MNTLTEKLKALGAALRELFPSEIGSIDLSVNEGGQITVRFHRCGTYLAMTEHFRNWGYGKRGKSIFPEGWSTITSVDAGMTIIAFCSDLPPTCRIEWRKKQIPKRETVDTGEFIEVTERVAVCGDALSEGEMEATCVEQDGEFAESEGV